LKDNDNLFSTTKLLLAGWVPGGNTEALWFSRPNAEFVIKFDIKIETEHGCVFAANFRRRHGRDERMMRSHGRDERMMRSHGRDKYDDETPRAGERFENDGIKAGESNKTENEIISTGKNINDNEDEYC
jgi:hypothetical protein